MPLNWRKWVFLFPVGKAVRYPNRGCYATTSCTWLITLTALFPRLTAPSEQSLANEAFKCSWLCLWRFNTGFPCMYVTVTAVTHCPLQPGMSPELDGGNVQRRAMDRIGEEQQNTQQTQPASKMEGSHAHHRTRRRQQRGPLKRWATGITDQARQPLAPIYPSDIIPLSHRSCCLPVGMSTARINLPTGICKKGTGRKRFPRLSSSWSTYRLFF